MGTPDESRVPSVRVKRATAILRMTSPTMGALSIRRWKNFFPAGRLYAWKTANMMPQVARKMSGKYEMNVSETAMTMLVNIGRSSFEPRSLKMVLKEGMTQPRRTQRTPAKMMTTALG